MINERHLAEKLKTFRKQRELSQTTLAELVGLRQKDISHMETCTGNSIDSIMKVCLYADACNIPYGLLFENEVNTGLSDFGYNVDKPIVLPYDHQNERKGDHMKPLDETIKNTLLAQGITVIEPDLKKNSQAIKDENGKYTILSSDGDLWLSKHFALNTTPCGWNVLSLGTLQDNYELVSKNLRSCKGNYVVTTSYPYEKEKELLRQEGYRVVDISFCKEPNYDYFAGLRNRSEEDIFRDVSNIATIIANYSTDSSDSYTTGAYRAPVVKLLVCMYLLSRNNAPELSFNEYIARVTKSLSSLERAAKAIKKNRKSVIWQCFRSAYEEWKQFSRKLALTVLSDIREGLQTCFDINVSDNKPLREICGEEKFAIFIDGTSRPSQLINMPYKFILFTLMQELFGRAFDDQKHKRRILGDGVKFLLDDFTHMSVLDYCNLDVEVAISAGCHISFLICLQSIYQITGYPGHDEYRTILGNASSVVCSSIMSAQDNVYLRNRFGLRKFDDLITSDTCLIHDNSVGENICIRDDKF